MGGKCPLELLQQTCASIGRESPSESGSTGGKKRKLDSKTEKSDCIPGAKQSKTVKEDINQNKYVVKTETESDATITVAKLAKMSPDRKTVSPRKSPPATAAPVVVSSTPGKVRPKVTSTSTKLSKTSPITTTPTVPGLSNMSSLMLNPGSLLHNAEIDRNLRAYASFYSASALQHPLTSAYPSSSFMPGMLPTFPYMPYFSGYPSGASALSGLLPSLQSTSPEAMAAQMAQLAALSQQQQAEQAAAAYALSAENALQKTAAEPSTERVCNWAQCGKKFSTAEKLAEHVKEHINTSSAGSTTSAPADSTTGSTPATTPSEPKLTTAAAATTLAPRFNPYGALSNYPRDLLNSRFVYS